MKNRSVKTQLSLVERIAVYLHPTNYRSSKDVDDLINAVLDLHPSVEITTSGHRADLVTEHRVLNVWIANFPYAFAHEGRLDEVIQQKPEVLRIMTPADVSWEHQMPSRKTVIRLRNYILPYLTDHNNAVAAQKKIETTKLQEAVKELSKSNEKTSKNT